MRDVLVWVAKHVPSSVQRLARPAARSLLHSCCSAAQLQRKDAQPRAPHPPLCSYNSVMKVTFLATAFSIIRYMRFDKVRPGATLRSWPHLFLLDSRALGCVWPPPSTPAPCLPWCPCLQHKPHSIGWHASWRGSLVACLPGAPLLQVVKQTYDKEQDTFRYAFLIAPCALLALVLNHKFTLTEVRRRRSLPACHDAGAGGVGAS